MLVSNFLLAESTTGGSDDDSAICLSSQDSKMGKSLIYSVQFFWAFLFMTVVKYHVEANIPNYMFTYIDNCLFPAL